MRKADAFDEQGSQGQEVRLEDVERLAPLRFQHINVHGTYHFTLPEAIARTAIALFDLFDLLLPLQKRFF